MRERYLYPSDPRHGTRNGYNNLGCRCAPCTTAARDYARTNVANRRAAGIPPQVHGTRTGYSNWGCRCEPCSTIGLAYARERYRKAKG